ncbi:MAG: DNA adenine methylase [Clostridium sp.]
MIALNQNQEIDYKVINVDTEWNDSENKELTMHTIHAYPAKFPAFIASKAFEYAKNEGIKINKVADIFCGCGTVALEARKHNYDFWGCDINPVATLIAKTKSCEYNEQKLIKYHDDILKKVLQEEISIDKYKNANERLKYWFTEKNYLDLYKLCRAIDMTVDDEKYKEAFQCIFSSILKACSKWLTKSIKPQIDPNKKEVDVMKCFEKQYKKFLKAIKELKHSKSNVEIKCDNFLSCKELPKVDLVITSPPYVTSYEYADLHQLSSLWLNYTDDYRKLRKGSIGSIYYSDDNSICLLNLNNTGRVIVKGLMDNGCPKSKIKSIARYYLDMQQAIERCSLMLNEGGMIFFVVGDTEYKGVKILNSQHLVETLHNQGFTDIKIGKRTISKGICVPFRDGQGKFSKDKSQRKIYHEEFIISGRYYR